MAATSRRFRWSLGIALCVMTAAVAAAQNSTGNLVVATASAQAAVDLPSSSVIANPTTSAQLQSITARELLLSELMSTQPVLTYIAHDAGLPLSSLSASTSYLQNIPEQMLGPDLEVRAMQIIKLRAPYQLDIEPDPNIPRLEIYTRAPTVAAAAKLADAAVPGLLDYLRATAVSHGVSPAKQVRVTQLGPALGGVASSHVKYEIAGLTFLIAFGLCAALLALGTRIRAGWKVAAATRREGSKAAPATRREGSKAAPATRREQPSGAAPEAPAGPSHAGLRRGILGTDRLGGHPAPGAPHRPVGSGSGATAIAARRRGPRRPADGHRAMVKASDDWPHTTRVLPWMIAAFLLVLWLVPFDSIQLGGSSLPIDLKFDRILLPVIVLMWMLALAAGGRAAPRVRMSWIHVGILGFAALACLTFVVNAHYLDETLQISRGIKQLMLLGAYVIFFVMVASVVRRSEIAPFLRYTLVLAVIAGIGTIIEYRFQYNIFYDLAHKLLPGFQVGSAQSSSVDSLGRRLVEGPAEVPLEAVGMFTLALPIALIGITDSGRWKHRLLYGLAAAVLVAGAVATERKSGLLGPLGVVVTIALFRRRQIVRLLPLALVLLAVVKIAAPGALGGITGQLQPQNLGVSTVDERVVRYDAIRPDVWLHLAIGQGFGVYSVRVLDNEFLDRLIEGGVLGLSAYVLMLLSIVFVAVGPARSREPGAATVGIVAAAAAIGTLVLSATYDSMGFPHVPYILFSLAGLLAVAVNSPSSAAQPRLRPIGPRRTRAGERPLGPAHPVLERPWRS